MNLNPEPFVPLLDLAVEYARSRGSVEPKLMDYFDGRKYIVDPHSNTEYSVSKDGIKINLVEWRNERLMPSLGRTSYAEWQVRHGVSIDIFIDDKIKVDAVNHLGGTSKIAIMFGDVYELEAWGWNLHSYLSAEDTLTLLERIKRNSKEAHLE